MLQKYKYEAMKKMNTDVSRPERFGRCRVTRQKLSDVHIIWRDICTKVN